MQTLIQLSNWWSLIPEQKFVSFPCRAVPKRLKDKLVSYILVLALIIDEFSLDFAVIMKDLKMPIPRYWKQNTCYCHWHEFLYFMRKSTFNSNMQASWISTKAIYLKRFLFYRLTNHLKAVGCIISSSKVGPGKKKMDDGTSIVNKTAVLKVPLPPHFPSGRPISFTSKWSPYLLTFSHINRV